MSIKKSFVSSLICVAAFLSISGCENDSNSPTKALTPPTYGTVEGIVYFAGTISPLPGVLVTCGDVSVTTKNDGKFSLKNVPAGFQILRATKNDYSQYARNIEVAENSVTVFDIDLTAASTNKSIKGIVYQKDNLAPLADVRVILVNDTTYTDAFGKYQLPIIYQGLKIIKAEKTGYNSFINQVFISNSDIQYDITLQKLP